MAAGQCRTYGQATGIWGMSIDKDSNRAAYIFFVQYIVLK